MNEIGEVFCNTIYLVIAEIGSYENYFREPSGFFLTKSKAEALVELLTEEYSDCTETNTRSFGEFTDNPGHATYEADNYDDPDYYLDKTIVIDGIDSARVSFEVEEIKNLKGLI